MFVLCCVVSGLCDHELFIRAEECYRVCECLSVSEPETSYIRRPRLGCCVTEGDDMHEEDHHPLSIYHVFDVYIGTSIRSSR